MAAVHLKAQKTSHPKLCNLVELWLVVVVVLCWLFAVVVGLAPLHCTLDRPPPDRPKCRSFFPSPASCLFLSSFSRGSSRGILVFFLEVGLSGCRVNPRFAAPFVPPPLRGTYPSGAPPFVGHHDTHQNGQSDRPKMDWPKSDWPKLVLAKIGFGQQDGQKTVSPRAVSTEGGGASTDGAPKGGIPKFPAFFYFSRLNFTLCALSGRLLVEFWWCLMCWGLQKMHVWALWVIV